MKLSKIIKPISYFKSHAAEVMSDLAKNRKSLVITQNGEARAVLQDVKTFEETQESLALLKMLALSSANLQAGKVKTASKVFSDLGKKLK